jgi:hypothetical protein
MTTRNPARLHEATPATVALIHSQNATVPVQLGTLFHGQRDELMVVKSLLVQRSNGPVLRLVAEHENCCLLWTRGAAAEVAELEQELRQALANCGVHYDTRPAGSHVGSNGQRLFPLCPFCHRLA